MSASDEYYDRERGGRQLDKLPPHSPEAEAGVLGCVLCAADTAVACAVQAAEHFQGQRVFFELRHQVIFAAMVGLAKAGALDLILLQNRLRELEQLDQVGGLEYLGHLPDTVPSAAMLPHYLEIVWEKYQAREFLGTTVDAVAQLYSSTATGLEPVLARIGERIEQIKAASARVGGLLPARLKKLDAYGEAYWDQWFGRDAEEPGIKLPFEFPFKVRLGEQTFLIAEKGAGKSTLMSYIRLFMLHAGMKACVASMEMKPAVTIKMMAAQLLGTTRLPDNEWGHQQARDAFTWLSQRVMIYDFLGIADWRDILHTFNHAAGMGFDFFEIDSVMRLGIMDDDLAQQGLAAATFAQFAMSRNAHLFIVNHLNKSDRSVKQRSRGSQQWIDNSHNVMSIELNEKKHALVENLREDRRMGLIGQAEFDDKLAKESDKHDSHFVLHNQRWAGSRQNGSRYLFFNRESLQLSEAPRQAGVDWLGRWQSGEKKV